MDVKPDSDMLRGGGAKEKDEDEEKDELKGLYRAFL